MKFKIVLLLIFSCLLCAITAKAQNADKSFADSLAKKFDYYRLKNTHGVLFAHFDKTVYTNNENVWFTAYLLNNDKNRLNNVLSAVLVKDDDHSIALTERFVMVDGMAFGNLFLPDSIATDNYSFILYTNEIYNGKPANTFIQPVTIKNTSETSFHATLTLLDTDKIPPSGKRRIQLVTNAKGSTIIANAVVTYHAGDLAHPFFAGKVKTDYAGQYIFSVPANAINSSNSNFEAKITFGKESNTVRLVLPVFTGMPQIRFYPEGGNLSDGVLNIVGWEAKNTAGNPVELAGVLFKDGKPEDTVYTNSYGIGKFRLYPQIHSRYYLKPLLSGTRDTIYNLPAVAFDSPIVTVAKAITNDTLSLIIRAKRTQKVFVVIHNFQNTFFNFEIEAMAKGKPVKVILDAVPKGISEITILDSLHRPCAERLFFAHYNRRNALYIHTDTDNYKKRQKVTIDLALTNADGKADSGLVSIACVQANRYEVKRAMDIESYFYLVDPIGRIPLKERYMGAGAEDKKYLEDVLLIKGWRRYTWPGLLSAIPKDTIKKADNLLFKGAITSYDKPLKKPKNLLMFKDSSLTPLTTDSIGKFTITNEQLFTAEDKKVKIFGNGKAQDGLELRLADPYGRIDSVLSLSYLPIPVINHPTGSIQDVEILTNQVVRLKQVNIKASKDDRYYNARPRGALANECGDYVCLYNILNCPNHRNDFRNRPAVLGETYTYLGQPLYTYMGCTGEQPKSDKGITKTLNGIYYAMEFYGSDYSKINPPITEYLSTIYWKHLLRLSSTTKNAFSFYTSDIAGQFKIIIQGISPDDVIYGEKVFKVVK